MKTFLPSLFILFAFAPLAHADKVKIAAVDSPPVSIQKDGKADGVGAVLVREIAKRAGFETEDLMITSARFNEVTANHVALFTSVQKNPERETKFRWIAKILEDHYCFVTLKKNKPVTTIDDAKKLKVGVTKGAIAEATLKKLGVTNYDGAIGNGGSARKLVAGVIDAWFTRQATATATIKNEGHDPNESVCSGTFQKTEQWLAASMKMPEDQFAKAQKAFKEIEKEGLVQEALAKFQGR